MEFKLEPSELSKLELWRFQFNRQLFPEQRHTLTEMEALLTCRHPGEYAEEAVEKRWVQVLHNNHRLEILFDYSSKMVWAELYKVSSC